MEKHSPTDVGAINQKIENGQVKVKGKSRAHKRRKKQDKRTKTKVKQHNVTGVKGKITDQQIIGFLKAQDRHVTSTEIRDALHFKSRTQARRVLRRLANAKQVNITTKKISDRRQVYTFGIA